MRAIDRGDLGHARHLLGEMAMIDDSPRTATVQLTLLPDGAIEMKYTDSITLPDAVVGVSPGRTGE